MKKIFTLLLAVLMIASMSVTAFAAETSATVGGDDQASYNQTIDVKGTYVAGNTTTGEYDYVSADITWGAMEFTYHASNDAVWNPSTHSYTTASEAWWEATGNTITVANHSEYNMAVALIFAKNENVTTELSASVEFKGDDFKDKGIDSDGIPYAILYAPEEGSKYDSAPSLTATITLEGALPSDWTNGNTIGTITILLRSTT